MKLVYIVDDDPTYHVVAKMLLQQEKLPYHVKSFYNGEEAWQHFQREKQLPDLVLLDLDMPVMTGWELLEAFSQLPGAAEQFPDIFVISASCHENNKTKFDKYPFVVNAFTKPLTRQIANEIFTHTNKQPAS